jgi:hypothetical protein
MYCAIYSTISWFPWSTAHVCECGVLSCAPLFAPVGACCCVPPCPGLELAPCLQAYHPQIYLFSLPSVIDTWYWTNASICLCFEVSKIKQDLEKNKMQILV